MAPSQNAQIFSTSRLHTSRGWSTILLITLVNCQRSVKARLELKFGNVQRAFSRRRTTEIIYFLSTHSQGRQWRQITLSLMLERKNLTTEPRTVQLWEDDNFLPSSLFDCRAVEASGIRKWIFIFYFSPSFWAWLLELLLDTSRYVCVWKTIFAHVIWLFVLGLIAAVLIMLVFVCSPADFAEWHTGG